MKKYLIIVIILLSSSIYGFGEVLSVEKLTDNDKNRTINSIAYLLTNGKNVNFRKIENSEEWYQSGNLKLKESKRGYSLLFDDTKFMKETDDNFLIKDTSKKFKASKKSIKKLKLEIKVKADKILKEYLPNDNYTFYKVGLDTDGVRLENGRIIESISMLSVIYTKTVNDNTIVGKDTATRLYFKPSGKLIGIKLVNHKSMNIRGENKVRIKEDIEEIQNYLKTSYKNFKSMVKFDYLKTPNGLKPVYSILLIPNRANKKILRHIEISDFNGVDSINEILKTSSNESLGDSK